MGRPRKPASQLKLLGTMDHDRKRYADRQFEPQATGAPRQPRNLPKWAKLHWEKIVPTLIETGVAKAVDQEALESMCIWWHEWKQLQAGTSEEKGYKRLIQMSMAHKAWRDLASRFGLTPSDRAKLTVENQAKKSKTAEFLA